MAITNQQIIDFLASNPNITGQELVNVMDTYKVDASQIASALSENAQQGGYQTTTIPNMETGQAVSDIRDLGAGFNAYQDESGQTSGFSRVDPSRPEMIQLYSPTGEYRGEQKITTTTQDLISNLGPIILAAGGTALAQGLMNGSLFGGPAVGNGAFLGEGVASGIPAFDAAYTAAGGVFNPAFGLPVGNGAFLGEGVPTGIPASDTAFLNAGGTFDPAFALGADGLVGTPLVTPPATTTPITTTTPPVTTTPVTTPPVVTTPVVTPPVVTPPFVTPSINDVIKTIGTIATVAAIPSIVSPKTTAPTGFDIVSIPTDWKTPNKPTTAPYTALSPINFGTRDLLKGTQFERFLDPNYGQVPEPVQYSQPSNLSYNDLMSILGSKQGMPSASSLSINDIISGIQNQYGQANRSAMG